jgi:hypothetical protein
MSKNNFFPRLCQKKSRLGKAMIWPDHQLIVQVRFFKILRILNFNMHSLQSLCTVHNQKYNWKSNLCCVRSTLAPICVVFEAHSAWLAPIFKKPNFTYLHLLQDTHHADIQSKSVLSKIHVSSFTSHLTCCTKWWLFLSTQADVGSFWQTWQTWQTMTVYISDILKVYMIWNRKKINYTSSISQESGAFFFLFSRHLETEQSKVHEVTFTTPQ